MAVIHKSITRLTVYSLKTREVVRQGLFCRAQRGPSLECSSEPGATHQANSAVWSCSRSCLQNLAGSCLTALPVVQVLWVHHDQRFCQVVAWHPHDEHLLVFSEALAVHIVGKQQHSGFPAPLCPPLGS